LFVDFDKSEPVVSEKEQRNLEQGSVILESEEARAGGSGVIAQDQTMYCRGGPPSWANGRRCIAETALLAGLIASDILV
jgi:hypothetical protein